MFIIIFALHLVVLILTSAVKDYLDDIYHVREKAPWPYRFAMNVIAFATALSFFTYIWTFKNCEACISL